MSLSLWIGFLLAATLIAVSPGPGAVTSMSIGLRYGYGSALRAIAGLQTALLIQLAVVAGGLGALLAASGTAFSMLKLLGAAYLIWLGIQKWRTGRVEHEDARLTVVPGGLFRQGLLVNLTNPKAIVFMAAFTPQFIDPTRPQWPQFAIIALTMCGVDTVVMSCYAVLATHLRGRFRSPRLLKAQNRFFGGIFVSAGALLAASRHS